MGFAAALLGLAAGCGAEPAAPLPTAALAEGVTLEATSGESEYRVALAGAEADVSGGGEIAATGTTVSAAAASAPPLDIQAKRSTWDLKGRSARFEGAVVVTRGPVTLRCDTLDVRYAGADVIDTVVATGGVTVDRGGRHASAERAELVGRTGKITLTGRPKLSEGVNALEGERIVLWLDEERADCEGGAGGPCRLVVAADALGR